MSSEVRVQGYRELSRVFREMSVELKAELQDTLRVVADPVRVMAEGLADSQIRNIGPVWDRMRIGVTTGGVYVAPVSRRRKGSPRPNLGSLLMNEAMLPARDELEPEVVAGVEAMLDTITRTF